MIFVGSFQWRVQEGGGGEEYNKSHVFSVFLAIYLLKLWLKLIASEASEEKIEKK